MSNPKHTPGPWKARKGMSYPAVVETKKHFEFIYVAEKENAIANAKLIAAAPDMLDALEKAQSSIKIQLTTRGGPQHMGHALDAIDAAIKKARGES